MPEIKCFCHCHIGKWISSLDCQCFHGMHQTKCSHCESPKPAQLDRRYVGIEDKNRKPIRENDLVEITYYRVGGGALPEKYKGEVIFKSGGFWAGDISFVEIMNNNALAIKGQKLPMDIEVLSNIEKPAQLAGEGENSEEYYILVQDQDSHWYVIPDLKQKEWQQWNESPNYGYEDLPNWAKEVGGWYGLVKFTNFIIK